MEKRTCSAARGARGEGEYVAIMGPRVGQVDLMNLIGCLDTPTAAPTLERGRSRPMSDDGSRRPQPRSDSFSRRSTCSATIIAQVSSRSSGASRRERHQRAIEALDAVGLSAGWRISRASSPGARGSAWRSRAP
jgi:hypothetical protein